MKKYLVLEGYVESANDFDWHFLSCARLVDLYKVNQNDCVFVRYGESARNIPGGLPRNIIVLKPRHDGDYTIPKR